MLTAVQILFVEKCFHVHCYQVKPAVFSQPVFFSSTTQKLEKLAWRVVGNRDLHAKVRLASRLTMVPKELEARH